MSGTPHNFDTQDDADDERPTEAVAVPWGSGSQSLEDFDPDSFDVSAAVQGGPTQGDDTDPPPQWEDNGGLDPFGHLTTGAELGGRYRLEKIIGRGAAGVVFQASHMLIDKKVAVKCLNPQLRNHPTLVQRFFQEARIAAKVQHPNVIEIFDGGDEKNTLFLAMELLVGETLHHRLDKGALPVPEAVELFLKVLDGVAAVHDKGVVHRDLKPENVFLTVHKDGSPGEPKVLDFGVSKLKGPGRKELTALGTVMGTPYYMAPEQMMSAKDVDARADVYSLGVMLYETVSGQLPYDGENVADIFTAAKRGDWVPLHQVDTSVSSLLSAVVSKAMQVDRQDRFESVRDMHRALAGAQAATAHDPSMFDPRLDSSRTLEDVRSPLADLPPGVKPDFGGGAGADLAKLASPPGVHAGMAPGPAQIDRMQTRELVRESGQTVSLPMWAVAAMIALAVLAVAGIAVAILALML